MFWQLIGESSLCIVYVLWLPSSEKVKGYILEQFVNCKYEYLKHAIILYMVFIPFLYYNAFNLF